ncbi:MAG: hypothetical protein V4732_12905 [Pseudomonadota bacterium]
MKFTKTKRLFIATALMLATSTLSEAATVTVAGGVIFYVSYDDLDLPGGISGNNNITQVVATAGVTKKPARFMNPLIECETFLSVC